MDTEELTDALEAEIEDAILAIEFELDRDLDDEERESVADELIGELDDEDS